MIFVPDIDLCVIGVSGNLSWAGFVDAVATGAFVKFELCVLGYRWAFNKAQLVSDSGDVRELTSVPHVVIGKMHLLKATFDVVVFAPVLQDSFVDRASFAEVVTASVSDTVTWLARARGCTSRFGVPVCCKCDLAP